MRFRGHLINDGREKLKEASGNEVMIKRTEGV
jgi:hypothetical protein